MNKSSAFFVLLYGVVAATDLAAAEDYAQREERANRQLFFAARTGDTAQARAVIAGSSLRAQQRNKGRYAKVLKEPFAAAYKKLHMAHDIPDKELSPTFAAALEPDYAECNEEMTPLDLAAAQGHVATVDLLSRSSRTLGVGLLLAIHQKNEKVVRILVGRASEDTSNQQKVRLYEQFATAVVGGSTKIVQVFLDNNCGLNPNAFKNRKPMRSVFHLAASRGHADVLQQLIEYEYSCVKPLDEMVRMEECIDALQPVLGKHTRTVLEYKGVEEVNREWSEEDVVDYVLPSMEFKDCENLTALQYAERHLAQEDRHPETREALAECVALLQNQQAGFTNFFVNKYFNALQS